MAQPQVVGAPAPKRITAQHPFFSCNPQGDRLFSVNPNIPTEDAMETASSLLAAATSAANDFAMDANDSTAWAVAYLVEMSKAAVDAAVIALARERRHE